MEENTARQLSAETIVNEFKTAHGNLDLLRVFLITGASDISRSYELVSKWEKNAIGANKANFANALKVLQNIELKRIALTSVMYNTQDIQLPVTVANNETIEKEVPTIMMLPSLNDVLIRVRGILTDEKDAIEANKQAFELLKTTVGQGRVLDAEGKPVSWDNDMINSHLEEASGLAKEIIEESKEEIQAGEKFGSAVIDTFISDMAKHGHDEPKIKDALKVTLLGKTITSSEADYFIKDEAVFEDYYTRMLSSLVTASIISKVEVAPVVDKKAIIATVIEEEVKPFLETLDKDETVTSLSQVGKKIRDIHESQGVKMSLQDAFLKARKLAETIAPNLLKRNKGANKNNTPTIPVAVKEEKPVEIYDESHNIQESNKPLWAEVEKYEYLSQLFTKATELFKLGNWKDALSMSTILISSGKIKETEASTETLKWDVDQIKLWYYNIVEASANGAEKPATVEVKAEIIQDKTNEKSGKEDSKTAPESSESSSKHEEKTEEVKQGPVPQAGSLETKENLSRLLKDNTLWKDTYKFKSFLVKTDHHRGGAMSLEIVDATNDQEKDLLITESNMTKFFAELTEKLVVTRNAQPEVKKIIMEKLSPFYELSNSEAKRIAGALVNEADAIRKANKANTKVEPATEKPTEELKPSTEVVVPEVVVPETEVPKTEVKEEPKEVIPAVEVKESAGSSPEISESPSPTEVSENTAGEDSTNSNDALYEGFEDILKAKVKIDLNKAIFAKVSEYKSVDEGVKAVFQVIDVARKDGHYKKSQIRNWKPTPAADLLSAIQRIVITGAEANKAQ